MKNLLSILLELALRILKGNSKTNENDTEEEYYEGLGHA